MEKGCNKRVDILTRCIIRRVHFKWGYMKKLRITGRERWNSLCLQYPLESTLCGPQGWIHTQLVCTACTYSHISHPAHTHTDTHTHTAVGWLLVCTACTYSRISRPALSHTHTHTHTQQLDGCWSVLPARTPASHALLLQTRAILSYPLTNTERSVMNL